MATMYHCAQSVDVDRFTDAYIRRSGILDSFAQLGCKTPRDVRQQCVLARKKGWEVFPPCDHHGPDGRCLGHAEEPTPGEREGE